MKHAIFSLSFCFLHLCLLSCGNDDHTVPTYKETDDTEEHTTELYDWEKSRTKITGSTDMVLLYGGGHHRNPYHWSKSSVEAYVKYVDTEQKPHWMFDSFLFLEIWDQGDAGANKMFANGYGLESANKTDWTNLINYYFQSETGIGALDTCIKETVSILGAPQQKRQIVISIPEPIVYQNPSLSTSSTQYWGMIDGKTLNFLNSNDRIKACQWYIDQVRAKFNEKNYQYVELAGFYWLAEKATDTRTILNAVATYLNKMNYSFNWIPYYGSDGYNHWDSLGFNYAYFQPNYFFNETTPDSRLSDACQKALDNNMNMEMEFDDNALAGRGKAYRLRNYMNVFREYGIWEKKRLAYYQGGTALLSLKNSANGTDNQLYHDFCNFVISRPVRSSN